MNKEKSSVKLALLMSGSALMLPYTLMSVLRNAPANKDVWLTPIFAVGYLVILNAPIVYLAKKYGNLTAGEIFKKLLGNIGGKLLLFLYALVFAFSFISYAIMAERFIKAALLPNTPEWLLFGVILIPAAYASFKGGNAVLRSAVITVPLILASIIIFAAFGAERMDVLNIRPILYGSGFLRVNAGAFLLAASSTEVGMLLFFGRRGESKDTVKTYALYLVLFAVFSALIILPVLLTFGYGLASKILNPYYAFASNVKFYRTVENLQTLNALINIPGVFLRLSAYCFMITSAVSEIAPKLSQKKLSLFFPCAVYVICLIPAVNGKTVVEFYTNSPIYASVSAAVMFLGAGIAVIIHAAINRKRKI